MQFTDEHPQRRITRTGEAHLPEPGFLSLLARRYWAAPPVALANAGHYGELVLARARIGLTLAVLLIPVTSFLSNSRIEHWIALYVALGAVAIATGILVVVKKQIWSSWLGFATAIGDITMVSLTHVVYILQGMPTIAANSRTNFTIYAVAIAATMLRFDVRICVTAGLLAVVQYAGIAWWSYAMWRAAPGPDAAIYGTIEIGAQVGRVILLLMMTWLSVAVVRQSARLRFASTHDPLTRLLNRAYFDERLAEEIERCRRTKTQLALAVIDLDRFKSINDTFGHPTGDAVLRVTSRAIKKTVRRVDVVARYGGEEFVIMLSGANPAQALGTIEKVRARVSELEIDVGAAHPPLRVTLSAGVAIYPDEADNAKDLFQAADQRLLQAKQGGRNRVVDGR